MSTLTTLMRRKLWIASWLLLFCSCTTPKPPLTEGPFLDLRQRPSSEEKIAIFQTLHEELEFCLGKEKAKKKGVDNRRLEKLADFTNPFQINIWHQGTHLFSGNSPGGPLGDQMAVILKMACKNLRDFNVSPEKSHELKIEVTLSTQPQALTPENSKQSRKILSQTMGLWGILHTASKKDRWIYPNEILKKNLKFKEVFEEICGTGMTPRDCMEKLGGNLSTFETVDFLETEQSPFYVDLYRLSPLISIEDITQENLLTRLKLTRDWFLNNMEPSGQMTYLYYPAFEKKAKTHNNMIRQLMTTLALFRSAKYLDDAELLAAAEKNLSYYLKKYMVLDPHKKIAYIHFRDKAKLGAAAFALLALLESETHPEREKLIGLFTNFILELQKPSGAFNTFFLPPNRNDNQYFYPGEAMLAMMTLYRNQPSRYPDFPEKVNRAFLYYRDFFRKRPNPAMVPWHTQALFLLYRQNKNPQLAEFIFEMNDFLIQIQNTPKALKNPEPDTLGRFFDPKKSGYGPPHASSTAVYTEGLLDALQLAMDLKDIPRIQAYRYAIRWGLRSLFQLQYTPLNSFYISDWKAVVGALHTSVTNRNIRVDNTQHTAMVFLKLLNNAAVQKKVLISKKKVSN